MKENEGGRRRMKEAKTNPKFGLLLVATSYSSTTT